MNIASEYTKIASENSRGFLGTWLVARQPLGWGWLQVSRGNRGLQRSMSGQLTIGWRTGLLDVGLEGPMDTGESGRSMDTSST